MAGLSVAMGQVTGLFGRGSGIPPVALAPDDVVVEPELQPASSEPPPAASSPAAAPCPRKPRRDSPAARLSSVQPSRGCIADHLFRGLRASRSSRVMAFACPGLRAARSFLTE